jgi:hypothetical protein
VSTDEPVIYALDEGPDWATGPSLLEWRPDRPRKQGPLSREEWAVMQAIREEVGRLVGAEP